ncbi:nucleoside/nucleotide kinase family protein [Flavimobilis marinus]|uniref:Panthothenate kinase n=1 Tax=Flavimobilis marinus TaxID=285351 RepID=A0A1I2FIV2_9MICO|nr:nucleoside/nucleotide kinase family protein [Flavimobilis marinus]GHG51902.1 nucleoside/nucleotide kinase family protein [Flavimobilis marinus]SFF05352.1 Panthothenate kinase [Flavimobilis marinus]
MNAHPVAGGLPELVDRARVLAATGERRLLGIAGPPGAGKSTLAAALGNALGEDAVVVPMDGFHLAEAELARLGRRERKGAVDTFDVGGFVSLLHRLAAVNEPVVYAPAFDRALEEPLAGSIPVPQTVPLVVVEGNYLLHDDGPWAQVRGLLAECWYVDLDNADRLARLVTRHQRFGRDAASARAHALGSDQRNADLIAATRDRADLVVCANNPARHAVVAGHEEQSVEREQEPR